MHQPVESGSYQTLDGDVDLDHAAQNGTCHMNCHPSRTLFSLFLMLLVTVDRSLAFSITSPTSNQPVYSGQELAVTVDVGTDSGVRRVRYFWYRLDEDPLPLQQTEPALEATAASFPPFGGMIRLPVEAIGTMRLLAVGDVVRGRLAGHEDFDELLIPVTPQAVLSSIEFAVYKPWRLDTVGKRVEVPVVGQFADGVTRRLDTAASGSAFRSSNEQVVKVSSDGVVYVVGNGKALLTVTNRGKEGSLEVVVEGDLEPNRPPVARVLSDVTVKAGTPVSLDGLNSNDPDGDPLRYEWRQTRGMKITLFNVGEAKATFVAPKVSNKRLLQFQLRVTDMRGPDTVKGADSLPAVANVWVEP